MLVAERSLTEVTTAVKLVRNALFTAAAVGLAVAIGLGLALSSTLTRRLGRLQRSALRITAEGPEAPAPTDRGRDEVGDLARALGRMQEELRRQEAARRAFVSTASHELRTPLTMLQGTMELLDEDLRDGGDLARRPGAGRERPRASCGGSRCWPASCSTSRASTPPCSCAPSRSSWARSRAPSPPSSRCAPADRDVDLDGRPHRAPVLGARRPGGLRAGRPDPDRQRAALRAARPADRGHRDARPRPGRRCASSDHGPGVPIEEREHIFERFHRGKATSAESGFGLGLAIGRELAERMGGTLELVDSAHGACFALTLPG